MDGCTVVGTAADIFPAFPAKAVQMIGWNVQMYGKKTHGGQKKNRARGSAVRFCFRHLGRYAYRLVVPIKILDCEYGTRIPVIVRRWLLKLGWMVA